MDLSTITDPREKEIAETAGRADTRQAELDKTREASFVEREKQLQPMENAVDRQIGEMQALSERPMPSPTAGDLKPPSEKIVDAHDYQNLSTALLGMALVGGFASKGNWMGASASLNGALKGYLEGDQMRAEKEFQDYQTKFKAAQAHDKAALDEFNAILDNKKISVNEMLTRLKIAGSKYDRQDVRFAAEQKSIDQIYKQVDSMRDSLFRVEAHDKLAQDQISGRLRAVTTKLEHTVTSGAENVLNDDGKWVVMQTQLGGNDRFFKMVQSRYGGKVAAGILNEVGRAMREEGVDPRTLNENQIQMLVQRSAQTQATNRLQGVNRLTESIKKLEDRVIDLTSQLNGSGIPAEKRTVNAVKTVLGDGALQELRVLTSSVGTQYVEAITMPGSNAQLHATASQWGRSLLDENMPIQVLAGSLKAMNREIAATHDALENQLRTGRAAVLNAGPTLIPPGGASPPAVAAPGGAPTAPYADPAKEQRYQEWKKAHRDG